MDNQSRFNVELHPHLPIMMTRFEKDFIFREDALNYTVAVKAFLDAQSSPVYYLFDLTNWNLMSFDELMQAAAQAARGKESNFHHPMNRHTLIITHDQLVSMGAEGLTGAAYDNAKIKVFHSVDEAIAFVNGELG